jgi:hypothetical protein
MAMRIFEIMCDKLNLDRVFTEAKRSKSYLTKYVELELELQNCVATIRLCIIPELPVQSHPDTFNTSVFQTRLAVTPDNIRQSEVLTNIL